MAKSFATPFPRPTQVKVVRRRVLQHDLDMYAAIAGKPAGMPQADQATEESVKVATAAKARPWSAAVLSTYLQTLSVPRIATRVVRPEVADWVRRLSQHAVDRLHEAQERLSAPTRHNSRRSHDHSKGQRPAA